MVVVLVVLVVSLAASSLRQVGEFLKGGCCVPRPLRKTSGIRASQVRREIVLIPRASITVWQRSCVDLGAAVRLFVKSCIDLKTASGLLEESIWRSRFASETLRGFRVEVKILSLSSLFYLTLFVSALL